MDMCAIFFFHISNKWKEFKVWCLCSCICKCLCICKSTNVLLTIANSDFHCQGLIGSGKPNVSSVVSIAQSQRLDSLGVGLKLNPAIEAFASLGAFGKCPSHEERDLHRWLSGLHNLQLDVYYTNMRVQVTHLWNGNLFLRFVSHVLTHCQDSSPLTWYGIIPTLPNFCRGWYCGWRVRQRQDPNLVAAWGAACGGCCRPTSG